MHVCLEAREMAAVGPRQGHDLEIRLPRPHRTRSRASKESSSGRREMAYLGCKSQAGDRFFDMSLQRTDHDEHERLGVAAERILEQVRELRVAVWYMVFLSGITECVYTASKRQ